MTKKKQKEFLDLKLKFGIAYLLSIIAFVLIYAVFMK